MQLLRTNPLLSRHVARAPGRAVCARHAAPPPPRARAIARATVATRASEARNLLRCSCAFRERPRPVARSAGGAAAAPPGAAPRDARWLAVGSRAAHYRDGPASGRNAARARRAASLRAAARHLRDTRHALRLVARAGDGGGLFRGLPRHAWYGQLRWNQPTPVESANSGGISRRSAGWRVLGGDEWPGTGAHGARRAGSRAGAGKLQCPLPPLRGH